MTPDPLAILSIVGVATPDYPGSDQSTTRHSASYGEPNPTFAHTYTKVHQDKTTSGPVITHFSLQYLPDSRLGGDRQYYTILYAHTINDPYHKRSLPCMISLSIIVIRVCIA